VTVPSFTFLAFALVVIAVFHLGRAQRWRQAVLLAANLAFLASFVDRPAALLPYAGFLLLGALGVSARRRLGAWTIWAFPLLVLIVFVWLKQYLFVPQRLLLPPGYLLVGLSYVFFRVMHLVIDGWESLPRGARGWLSYLNYVLNFTSLVSGPIQRYDDYQRSEHADTHLTREQAWLAAERVITGFFKVYIVSAVLQFAQQSQVEAFMTADAAGRILRGAALTGLYPVYLYFNFSGYTDFVIGIARFLHLELPENFDRPFAAGNFIIFWSRWHMSLSNWFKTYVYTPATLAMMRRSRSPKLEPVIGVAAYFLTFFLVGLWHGQTSEFVFFGFLLGGGVAGNKLYQIGMARVLGRARYQRLTNNPSYAMLMRGLTFTWFAFSSLWFWSSWSQLASFAQRIGFVGGMVALTLVLAVASMLLEALARLGGWMRRPALWGETLLESPYVRLALALDMIVIVAFAALAVHAPRSQIVYQRF
jgi:D-alanyl-lipoteichoic acid acyltransferase DltB (MBOAT superfamily)